MLEPYRWKAVRLPALRSTSKAPRPVVAGPSRDGWCYFLTLIVVLDFDGSAFEFAAGLKEMVTL